jgi:pSer/pThr/pTyr-binding forkhead associated (FHA) protein
MAQFQLVMKQGPVPGKTFELTRNELTIGRDVKNEIVINDAEVSRRHCRLSLQGDGYTIEDLGSTNGTFVNEQRVTGQRALRSGETIRVGDNVTLTYELAGYDADATIASREAQPPPPKPRKQPQQYAGQVPPGPAAAPKKGASRALIIGCGVILVMGICAIAVGLYWIDANYMWCDIFGSLLPGCR